MGNLLPRTVSRFAAIQALFQQIFNKLTLDEICKEVTNTRFTSKNEYALFPNAVLKIDLNHFHRVITQANEKDEEINHLIQEALPQKWTLDRLELSTKCLLQCSIAEFLVFSDIPKAVIINEYVMISHAFLLEKGPAFINAVLDRVGQKVRPSFPSDSELN